MTDIPDDLLDEVERARIYVASKTRHAPVWQRMRDLCGALDAAAIRAMKGDDNG